METKKQDSEVKAQATKKDHFAVVDKVFDGTAKAHGSVDKMMDILGPYKNPLIFTMIVSFVLEKMGYETTASIFGSGMLVILLLKFILSRGDGVVKEKANDVVDIGIEKLKEMKASRDAAKKAASVVQVPPVTAPVEEPKK